MNFVPAYDDRYLDHKKFEPLKWITESVREHVWFFWEKLKWIIKKWFTPFSESKKSGFTWLFWNTISSLNPKTESFENLKLNLITDNVINESYKWNLQEATYKGKKVTLNRPFRQSAAGKKFAVYVKSASGNVKKIRFGAQGYRVRNANKAAASNFQKRHKCSEKKDKTKAGYWACRAHLYSSLKLSSSRTW